MSGARRRDEARLGSASDEALGALVALPASLVLRLRRCPRTAPGLDAILHRRLAGLLDLLGAAQERVLGLDDEGLRRLALCAGAVRHARSVLHLLDGGALRAFVAALGPEPRAAALRWHDLAGGEVAAPGDGPIEMLVARDGWRCLHAWCEAQPAALARRLALSLPPDVVAMGEAAPLGVRIVEALAGQADA